MSLFNKFFQPHRQKNDHDTSTEHCTQDCSLFPFSSEQVRVLLFRECDWTGRRLLFDSSSLEKFSVSSGNQSTKFDKLNGQKFITSNNEDSSQSFIDMCNGYGYTYNSAANDGSNIGEMVFGSVAMSFEGTSLKVHWLQNPKRILCSQVFLSPVPSKQSFNRKNSTSRSSSIDHSKYNLKSNQSVKKLSDSFSLPLSLCLADKLDSLNGNHDLNSSVPLDVPSTLDHNSFELSGCDSGYSRADVWAKMSSPLFHPSRSNGNSTVSIFSTDPSIVSSRKLSIASAISVDAAMKGRNSNGCLQRRILRNLSTSFENNLSRNDVIGYFDESQILTDRSNLSIPNSMVRRHSDLHGESINNPGMASIRLTKAKDGFKPPKVNFSSRKLRTKTSKRRSKMGLAVCIRFSESVEDEMQSFCSEHIALLESMLCRLRVDAESACVNQKRFYQLMLHAWFAASSWVTDLFTAPRIHEPVWLTLSNGYFDRPNSLAKHFMTELCWLLNSADTKDTNFFISTLLTAILTNHLGWVATVAPIINNLPSNNDQVFAIHQNQKKMMEISKFHPYNVLWAQLSDLYGSVGCPSRLAKTIICGANTLTINKVLNVLTYFVRCSEIQRVECTKVLNNIEIENIIMRKSNRNFSSYLDDNQYIPISKVQAKNPFSNEQRFKDLSNISDQTFKRPMDNNGINYSFHSITNEFGSTELLNSLSSTIKLMVTSPNNDQFECETASEALEFILKKVDSGSIEPNQENRLNSVDRINTENCSNNFGSSLWSIDTVTDGIAFEIRKATNTKLTESDKNKLKRCQSFNRKSNVVDELRKSRTLRQMSSDINGYAGTGITFPDFIDNNMVINSNESINIQKSDIEQNQSGSSRSVVFVLGDDDVLFDLKAAPSKTLNNTAIQNSSKKIEKLISHLQVEKQRDCVQNLSSTANISSQAAFLTTSNTNTMKPEKKMKHCTHKKHSGVKFNFEQYPQIVTNYMKNKNLDVESYDFLEKGLKLEQENAFNYGASSSILPKKIPEDIQELEEQEEEQQCECCANTFRILQTPSNATELEFSSEDGNYPVPINNIVSKPMEKLRPIVEFNSQTTVIQQTDRINTVVNDSELIDINKNNIGESFSQSNETTKENYEKHLQLLAIPIPETKIVPNSKTNRIRAGYVPSLFVGITDHFIPDMVLQGTTSPLAKWEPILKQNLTLSSHCATFEQIPTENVAIIANVDKWDVRLVTSQSFALEANGLNGPIGMSQLVSTMLETVHAMWLAGTPAYQCMSFMESKLKEIYLQSEALAAFLLATEFCSLNTVTSALNLSENDVPLLLSVASIHSPQVTKKYGISFR